VAGDAVGDPTLVCVGSATVAPIDGKASTALVSCVNACDPASASCITCCTEGLSDVPAELDAVASCSKVGEEPVPTGCEWPPTER